MSLSESVCVVLMSMELGVYLSMLEMSVWAAYVLYNNFWKMDENLCHICPAGYKTVLCGWSGRTVLCNGWQDEECDEIGNVEKSDNIF